MMNKKNNKTRCRSNELAAIPDPSDVSQTQRKGQAQLLTETNESGQNTTSMCDHSKSIPANTEVLCKSKDEDISPSCSGLTRDELHKILQTSGTTSIKMDSYSQLTQVEMIKSLQSSELLDDSLSSNSVLKPLDAVGVPQLQNQQNFLEDRNDKTTKDDDMKLHIGPAHAEMIRSIQTPGELGSFLFTDKIPIKSNTTPTDKCTAPLYKKPQHENNHNNEEAVGVSPCKRYLKYAHTFGRGSLKEVFRGLDSQTGVPVAWCELLEKRVSKAERLRFREEAELLKELQHPNIVRFYDYWEDIAQKKINVVLITELMASGTLKDYLKRFKKLNSRIFKEWCIQILKAMHYLHSRTPPIIHRDLKCDNIFINGESGRVKIGDLGLSIRKQRSFVKSVVGTPEFMAPEMYEEHYDESVDIYAFGMCMLEMLVFEYPYSECSRPTQIYKMVTAGIKPAGFYKIEDSKARSMVEWCIQHNKEDRPTINDLLNSDFFIKEKWFKLNPVFTERFLNDPEINEIEFQLRLLDPKKRSKHHQQDEAIQFSVDIRQDSCETIAREMCRRGIVDVADSILIKSTLKAQVLSLQEKRKFNQLHTVPRLVELSSNIKAIRTENANKGVIRIPKLGVTNIENGKIVYCFLENRPVTITFKFDVTCVDASVCAANLLKQGLLVSSQIEPFMVTLEDIIRQVKLDPTKLPKITTFDDTNDKDKIQQDINQPLSATKKLIFSPDTKPPAPIFGVSTASVEQVDLQKSCTNDEETLKIYTSAKSNEPTTKQSRFSVSLIKESDPKMSTETPTEQESPAPLPESTLQQQHQQFLGSACQMGAPVATEQNPDSISQMKLTPQQEIISQSFIVSQTTLQPSLQMSKPWPLKQEASISELQLQKSVLLQDSYDPQKQQALPSQQQEVQLKTVQPLEARKEHKQQFDLKQQQQSSEPSEQQISPPLGIKQHESHQQQTAAQSILLQQNLSPSLPHINAPYITEDFLSSLCSNEQTFLPPLSSPQFVTEEFIIPELKSQESNPTNFQQYTYLSSTLQQQDQQLFQSNHPKTGYKTSECLSPTGLLSLSITKPTILTAMLESDIKDRLDTTRNLLSGISLDSNTRLRLQLLFQRQCIEEDELRLKHLVELEEFLKIHRTACLANEIGEGGGGMTQQPLQSPAQNSIGQGDFGDGACMQFNLLYPANTQSYQNQWQQQSPHMWGESRGCQQQLSHHTSPQPLLSARPTLGVPCSGFLNGTSEREAQQQSSKLLSDIVTSL